MSVQIPQTHLEELGIGTINRTRFRLRPVFSQEIIELIRLSTQPVIVLELLPVDFEFFPIKKLNDWAIHPDSLCDLASKMSVREKILSKYLPSLPHQECKWFGLMSEKERSLDIHIVAGHIDIAEKAAHSMFK